jgi:predicted unusual protein kinase regulating ubiquinone biosynthesis (AarF/ABC1/UbiB family)
MIRETLKFDLRLLNTFMQKFYIKFSSKNMETDSRQALKDFASATMKETDYRAEVAFAHELFEAYRETARSCTFQRPLRTFALTM